MTAPADIEYIRKFLVSQSLCSNGEANNNGTWPCFLENIPGTQSGIPVASNVIGIFTLDGMYDGRYMSGGTVEHPSCQIRVESVSVRDCAAKIKSLADALDALHNQSITVETTTRTIISTTRSQILRVGWIPQSVTNLHRFVQTMNVVFTFR